MSDVLQVTTLGEFSLQWNGQTLDDSSNRMRKVWLLLAYLIYARNSHTTQENYLALMRETGGHETDDPAGRLKTLFYRARTMLGQQAGHQLIVRRKYPHSPANIHYSVQPLEPMAPGALPHLDK